MEASAEDQQKCKVRKIDSFFKLKKPSLELLGHLTAVDGFTFNQIATSERLCQTFKAESVIKEHKCLFSRCLSISETDFHSRKHECSKGSKAG